MILRLPNPDLRALISGETIVAFVTPGEVAPGDEVRLDAAGPRPPEELKPAYRRWSDVAITPGEWTAAVDDVAPAGSLDPTDGDPRHILAVVPGGDIAVLRVRRGEEPVLTGDAFAARRNSLASALRS